MDAQARQLKPTSEGSTRIRFLADETLLFVRDLERGEESGEGKMEGSDSDIYLDSEDEHNEEPDYDSSSSSRAREEEEARKQKAAASKARRDAAEQRSKQQTKTTRPKRKTTETPNFVTSYTKRTRSR
jgi:hypothetical protein